MPFFNKIFETIPSKFTVRVNIRFVETLVFEGWLKTADQLFTDKKTALPPLIYHIFHFEISDVKYEFKVQDEKNNLKYSEDKIYTAWLPETDLTKCWFAGEERLVYLWEPDEE